MLNGAGCAPGKDCCDACRSSGLSGMAFVEKNKDKIVAFSAGFLGICILSKIIDSQSYYYV